MLFPSTLLPTVFSNSDSNSDGTINFPDEGGSCLNGFLQRVQLIDIASVTAPVFPIVGELWVDISELAIQEGEPSLKIWNGEDWISSSISGADFKFTSLTDTPNLFPDSPQYIRVSESLDSLEFTDLEFLTLKDVPNSYEGQSARFLRVNATEDGLEFSSGTGLLVSWTNILFENSSILDLEDTPLSYANQSGKFLSVNENEDGLEFTDISILSEYNSFVSLEDTPESLATQAGNTLRVNSTETELEFIRPSQIIAAGTPIGKIETFAFSVTEGTRLYTDARTGLVYYNPMGWSIGNVGSAAEIARSDWLEFYRVMWSQPYTSIIGGKSTTAAKDFSDLRSLQIPSFAGRFLLNRQTTLRPFGSFGGESEVSLTEAQMPSHTHPNRSVPHTHGINQTPHSHSFVQNDLRSDFGQKYSAHGGSGNGNKVTGGSFANISLQSANVNITIEPTGEGQSHENMPPYFSASMLIFTGLAV